MKRLNVGFLLAAVLTAAAACSENTVTLAGNQGVSVSTRSARTASTPFGAPPASLLLDDTLTAGDDTLIVTSAQVVFREIEVKRTAGDCAAAAGDDCEELEFGPVLVDLPLEPGAARLLTVELPFGSYVEIEFDVHKPDDGDPQDQEFLAQHPEFDGVSIRVQGTFNGDPFDFTTDLNVDEELQLQPPVVVMENTATNITIFVELAGWFRDENGNLVDPDTANKDGDNENLVKDNIIDSFRAFEDQDEDGDDRD